MLRFFKKDKPKRAVALAPNNTLIDTIFKLSVPMGYISNDDILMIERDTTFSQAHTNRSAATKKQDIAVLCKNEEISKTLLKYFRGDIISQALETYKYGINVFEVNYKEANSLWYPLLVQRDFRSFRFESGELKFIQGGITHDIPPYKVIYGLNDPNFIKPYGDAIYSKLYFPIKMKNASLKFWMQFIEKFGSPWAVAKTSFDAEGLAKELYAMLAGDAAVINEDEEITITQPSRDSGHDKLVSYCDEQISKVILGANLTSNVTGGSLAAAEIHNNIRDEIALGDAKILLFILNRACQFFKEINRLDIDIEVKLFDKSKPNTELATRDLQIYNMGFVPTVEYIEETYNIEIDRDKTEQKGAEIIANKTHPASEQIAFFNSQQTNRFEGQSCGLSSCPEKQVCEPSSEGCSFITKSEFESQPLNGNLLAFKNPLKKPLDDIDASLQDKEFLNGITKVDEEMEQNLTQILKDCSSYDDAYEKLLELYDVSYDELERLLFNAIVNIEMVQRTEN